MAYAFTYMLANRKNGVIYVGVTSDLGKRMSEHKSGAFPGFTKRYGLRNLVWFGETEDMLSAIAEEKRLKNWKREWKIQLIERENPDWKDLSEGVAA